MHFEREHALESGDGVRYHHRIRRNVFLDMLEDMTDDGSDEDDEDEQEENEEAESNSESVESTTTRFGRFISPLAFSKISETLGYCV